MFCRAKPRNAAHPIINTGIGLELQVLREDNFPTGMITALSSLATIFGEGFTIHFLPTYFFFFWSGVQLARTPVPILRPGSIHSGSASLDDCGLVFPDEFRMNSFSWQVPTLCLDIIIVSPLRLRWVKGVCVFRCNLPPALLEEWRGSFACRCGNTGVERTQNKGQHTELTLEKKMLLPFLPRLELAAFHSRVWRSYQQAIQALPVKSSIQLWLLFSCLPLWLYLHGTRRARRHGLAILVHMSLSGVCLYSYRFMFS